MLPADQFRVRKNTVTAAGEAYVGLRSRCKSCELKWNRDFFKTPQGRQYKRERLVHNKEAIRGWIHERLASWRAKTPGCDLSTEYLIGLFNEQGGLCYYTGATLKLGIRPHADPDGISLDRLAPEVGYMVGNVAFCTYRTNTMKGALTETEFYAKMRLNLSMADARRVSEAER